MKYLASHSILTFLSALLAVTMPFLCHAEPESKVRLKTVVLDPGHGGHDAGCVSKDGKTYEKNLTLSIARQVGNKIKAAYPDVKVIYTRTTDKFIPLNERAEIANRNKADLFISIHINAVDSSSPTGTSSLSISLIETLRCSLDSISLAISTCLPVTSGTVIS